MQPVVVRSGRSRTVPPRRVGVGNDPSGPVYFSSDEGSQGETVPTLTPGPDPTTTDVSGPNRFPTLIPQT